jgi:hypothetical protein
VDDDAADVELLGNPVAELVEAGGVAVVQHNTA